MTAHHIHRVSFLTIAGLSLVLVLISAPEASQSFLLLFGIVVLVAGVPHGAVDPLIARRMGLWNSPLGLVMFSLIYLGIAGAALMLWLVAPLATLALFLAISAWHFAGDWRPDLSVFASNAIALSLLTLPALFHGADVASIFSVLTQRDASVLIELMALIAPVTSGLSVIFAAKVFRRSPSLSAEILLLLVCAAVLPPLIFFLIYFCFMHSPRHLLRTADHYLSSEIVKTLAVFTGLTVLLTLAALWLVPTPSWDERILQIIFVGLFVLTVPHMLLIELNERRRS